MYTHKVVMRFTNKLSKAQKSENHNGASRITMEESDYTENCGGDRTGGYGGWRLSKEKVETTRFDEATERK